MKKKTSVLICSFLMMGVLVMLTNSCKEDDNNDTPANTIKDIDGNVYHTVTIGTQVWMVENLKTTKYRNGDAIPNVTDSAEWFNLATGAQCNYNHDAAIGNKYGKLYNWYAVSDIRNIAPTGWHVPTDAEWTTLEEYVAYNLGTSGSVAKALASKTDWVSSTDAGAVGNDLSKNNTSGFSGLPGGYRGDHGGFAGVGLYGGWWTSSEDGDDHAWIRGLNYHLPEVYRLNYYKEGGSSVRCLRDY
jgi:uncharacterized protein (TIGR02145 family)